MKIPADFLRMICYIGHLSGGEDKLEGTGFFIAVAAEDSKNRSAPDRSLYVVTAKHVADAVEGNFWLRINQKDGTALTLSGDELRWTHHPEWSLTNQVDVAVALVPYDERLALLALEPSSFVYDPVKQNVNVGDEAFVLGLFTNLSGSKRNTPIARTGNLAMLPEDKIPTDDMGDIDAYLLEVRSYGGMSGAPVFVRETVATQALRLNGDGVPYIEHEEINGPGRIWLIGLMHGHWDVDATQIRKIASQHDESDAALNLGIAIVVPAFQIAETLNHPDLVAERIQELANLRAGNPSRLVAGHA